MAKRTKSVTVATSGPASEPRLRGAAGLLPGTVEKGDAGDAGAYELRLLSGDVVRATVRAPCSAALVDECMRAGRIVLAVDTGDGYAILGALQTAPSPAPGAELDVSLLRGRDVRIEGDHSVRIGTSRAALELGADGQVRLRGNRLTIDVAALIRLLGSKVELP